MRSNRCVSRVLGDDHYKRMFRVTVLLRCGKLKNPYCSMATSLNIRQSPIPYIPDCGDDVKVLSYKEIHVHVFCVPIESFAFR